MTNALQTRMPRALVLVLLTLTTAIAAAQTTWDEGLEQRTKFLLYPHVDAGLRAFKTQRFGQAIDEFEHALSLAPDNPVILGYLVNAHVALGQYAQAVAILQTQLKQIADKDQTKAALTIQRDILYEQWFDQSLQQAQAVQDQPIALGQYLDQPHPDPANAYQEHQWLTLLGRASSIDENRIERYRLQFTENQRHQQALTLNVALQSPEDRYAIDVINRWPRHTIEDPVWIEQMSFELANSNRPELASFLLMKAYPYTQATPQNRTRLFNRLLRSELVVTDPSKLATFTEQLGRRMTDAQQEQDWLILVGGYLNSDLQPLVDHQLLFASNQDLMTAQIIALLERGAPLPIGPAATAFILRVTAHDAVLLDQLTYQLVLSNREALAWQALMAQYPFTNTPESDRDRLVARMGAIAGNTPTLVTARDRIRLSTPLPHAKLRQIQAVILRDTNDCGAIRTLLGQQGQSQTPQAWHILGQCYETLGRVGLAQVAFERAAQLSPTAFNERALAYAAYSNRDDKTALAAWQRLINRGQMKTSDWLAAVVTARAAKQLLLADTWLAAYETASEPQTAQYWSLKAQSLGDQDPDQAIVAMQRSVSLVPRAEHYLLLANWQEQTGDTASAIASLQNALQEDPNLAQAHASLGFIFYAQGRIQDAKTQLLLAQKAMPRNERITQQLAYTFQRLGQNQQSIDYANTAIDQLNQYTDTERTPEQTDIRYGLRRMNEDLARRWTFSLDTLLGSSAVASVDAPNPGQNFRRYTQLEVDYRLGDPAINNGKTLSIYARVFGGSQSADSPWSVSDPVLGVGLRWKPLSTQVVYLALERQTPLESGSDQSADTMARVSASFFNDGQYSDDWHPNGSGWVAQNLYLDAAYYLESDTHTLTADYRLGYHYKLGSGQTIEPYGRLMANQLSTETVTDLRAAAGVRFNLWARESTYQAYATRFYIGLEAQAAIQTYQSDKFAVLVTAGVRW